MTNCTRPKLHLPLALLADLPVTRPATTPPPRLARFELRRLVAAMID